MTQENDRRDNFRYHLALLDDNKLQSFIIMNDNQVKIKCLNLSLAGVSFQFDKEKANILDKNVSYQFRFIINNSVEVMALGQLIWKTQLGGTNEDCFSTGFHLFISDEKQKEELQNFLNNI